MNKKQRKVHVIVGCGTSGAALCRSLSEEDDIILIERGKEVLNGDLNPQNWSRNASTLPNIKNYWTVPQFALSNRIIKHPQGTGVGGTANINAMIWTCGHRKIFDKYWPRAWSSATITRLLVAKIIATYVITEYFSQYYFKQYFNV